MPREVVFTPYGEQSRGLGVSGEAIQPSEVLARHGVGGNAEILIQAVRDHNPARLVAARAKRINFDLAAKLKAGTLEFPAGSTASGRVDVAAIAGEGATVQDVNVRGVESVCYAATDSQGTLYHGTFDLSDPEGTHISQAEILAQAGSVAAPIVNAKRQAAGLSTQAERNELAAREKALADREKAIMEQEQNLEAKRIELSEQSAASGESPLGDAASAAAAAPGAPGTASQPGGGQANDATGEKGESPERPASLPAGYDELDAKEAAKVVHALEGDEREQAVAYEKATKGRKTVTGEEPPA